MTLAPHAARTESYALLGVTESATLALPRITHELRRHFRRIAGQNSPSAPVGTYPDYYPRESMPTDPYYYLSASDAPEATALRAVFYSIPKRARRYLPIEAFCLAAGVSPLRILQIITESCMRLNAQASSILAASNHPRVVEKTISMALTDEGIEDRKILHKATGFLPSPKGSQTTVNVSQQASATAAAQSAALSFPPPEQTIKRLVDRFNESKSLPPGAAISLPEAQPSDIPAAIVDAEYVEVGGDDDEDE